AASPSMSAPSWVQGDNADTGSCSMINKLEKIKKTTAEKKETLCKNLLTNTALSLVFCTE
ncbi:MAG TPA: hypothetical protein QF431_01325, partial [Acidimicrobiales bacterium]|nr:hypothetical protein [Acidimicrobiales bacterium]